MGREAKARKASGALKKYVWHNLRQTPPPFDWHPIALGVTVTCSCAEGGRMCLSAARHKGEWVIEHCSHSFDITHYMLLDEPPKAAH